ncbi:MAG: hypothetical protein ACYTGX_04710 [Planctomycetota bacterium]|jgi:hypothetical protein
MTLVVIATPFAVSMRLQERAAFAQQAEVRVEMLGRSASNYVINELNNKTSLSKDQTPDYDGKSEFQIAIDALAMGEKEAGDLNDPKGKIVSVEVSDEQSKINLNSVSAITLGNLFGAGQIQEPVTEDADEIVLDDATGFYSDGKSGTIDGYVNS